jgi:hypothetical protein
MDVVTARRVLGLAPGYRRDELEEAFRACARRLHPDVGGDTAEFQRVVEARDTLRGQPAGAGRARVTVVQAESLASQILRPLIRYVLRQAAARRVG